MAFWCKFADSSLDGSLSLTAVEFKEAEKAKTVEDFNEALDEVVKRVAMEATGHRPHTIYRLPYSRVPNIRKGVEPNFCFGGDECFGKTACPRKRSCVD